MVDVNTQNKTISVNVSSSGVSSNVNASGDATLYYSNKAREWAISNRIVDGVDYSSKYYANLSEQHSETSKNWAITAQEANNNVIFIADTAIENIQNQETSVIENIETVKDAAVVELNTAEGVSLTNIQQTSALAQETLEDTADELVDYIDEKGGNFLHYEEIDEDTDSITIVTKEVPTKLSELENDVNFITSLDVDVSDKVNFSQAAMASMPSGEYIELTKGASGTTFTAPASGYFTVMQTTSVVNGYIILNNRTSQLRSYATSAVSGFDISTWVPANAGDVVAMAYNGTSSKIIMLRFYYAAGEV